MAIQLDRNYCPGLHFNYLPLITHPARGQPDPVRPQSAAANA